MKETPNKTKISVVVCTYNRSDLLPVCLQSLADQDFDKDLYEVVVIDNNSTDNTKEITNTFAQKCGNFRVVSEIKQGLSHARNRGWKESCGEYTAYIDDDAKAYPDWLASMLSFIERRPKIVAFGGPYELFTLVPPPKWFPPEYGSWNLGDEERPIRVGAEWINGTNMVFKREILQTMGGFNSKLGMSGDTIAYGEETSLLLNLAKDNMPIYYVPQIKVKHLLAEYKMNLKWLLKSSYANGRNLALTFNKRRSLPSHIAYLGLSLVVAMGRLLSIIDIPLKRRLYYSFVPAVMEWGRMVEYFSDLKRG